MDYFKTIQEKYKNCKAERNQYMPLWEKGAKYFALKFNDSIYTNKGSKSKQLDECVEDSTAALAIQQASDYTTGILRGNADDMLEIVPSRYVEEMADYNSVAEYYKWATEQFLYHINHHRSGFTSSLSKTVYGDWGFGNSGLGVFKNKAFEKGIDDNCLTFRSYNVDTISFAEGASGLIEFVFADYCWPVSRIVREFCFDAGVLDNKSLSQMPEAI